MPDPEAPSLDEQPVSVGRAILDALRGVPHDYTVLPLKRAVLLLAVPMVMEMIMESLFALADVFWVSHLGRDAIAVVGLTESLMSTIYAVGFGISFAAGAIVARRIGEKDTVRAAQAAGQVILLGATLSTLLGLALGLNASRLLTLMGAEPAVVELGHSFATIMFGGNATVFLIFLINAVFRGAGDPALAMRTLILANGLNLILDPCFIFGWGPFPELGLNGAAVATNLGRGIGVVYQIWHLTGDRGRLSLHWSDLKPRPEAFTILRTSANGVAQMLITTTSWIGLFKILAVFGSAAVAGYTITIRLIIFALMPAWGLSNAGATLVGQNLGARAPDRAEQAVRIAVRYNVIFLGLVGIVFIACCRPLIGVFTTDPAVTVHAVRSLWIVSLAFPLYAAGMCLEGTFNGAGDTWTPTRLNFFTMWLGQVPLAWLLSSPLDLGPTGVFIAVPVSFSALTTWSWLLFRAGHWKAHVV